MKTDSNVPDAGYMPPVPASAFLVGQDREGRWLAVQAGGRRGGIFLSRDAAVHYARDETERREGAVSFVAAPLRLV